MRLLLDTNAYSAMQKGDSTACSVIRTAEHLYLPHPVVGELLYGFRLGTKEHNNRQTLQEFLATSLVSLIGIDFETCEVYARIGQQLRKTGTPIPTNDHWIASIALRHNLALLSRDEHFQEVAGLDLRTF